MEKEFDAAVIGAGPGGYPAAIRIAQQGKKVALIEAKEVGGVCLNCGCIPSKALISNANLWEKVKRAEEYGIHVGEASFDFAGMAERKDRVVAKVRKNLEGLIASNRITLLRGYGKFLSPREIKVNGEDNVVIRAEKSVIATGSRPRNMAAFPFDHERIHDSTSMLGITKLPKSLIIIGGGVIGSEFASLYSAFGVEVTILELMPSLIPMECQSVSKTLTKAFKKRGIAIETNVKVEKIDKTEEGVKVFLAGGEEREAEMALVCVGRELNIGGIGLDKAGVAVGESGLVEVDDRMETNVAGIFAIGDIASRWWLAHVASHQGLVAASNIVGIEAKMHYNAVPSVIFTEPEIGTVGLTLEEAVKEGYSATLGAFPFQALGKSQATLETEGFAQVVIDKETRQVLGAQVVGHEAATLVAEMGVAIANEMTLECITETIHAHPTIAEIWLEAAMMANDTPLHLPPKKHGEKAQHTPS